MKKSSENLTKYASIEIKGYTLDILTNADNSLFYVIFHGCHLSLDEMIAHKEFHQACKTGHEMVQENEG